jgi:predicted aspartyl protease
MARNWLPFLLKATPVVRVRIGPSRFSALIDTGAQISMIAPDVAIILGLPSIGLQAVVGITGKRENASLVQLPSIGFGCIELASCRAAVIDVKQLGLKIEMLLGVNAFNRRRIQFDFIDERVYIIE